MRHFHFCHILKESRRCHHDDNLIRTPMRGCVAVVAESAESGVTPQDFGTNNHPFTTARADLFGLNDNAVYPYRAAGKLFFNIGSSSYICSASLIKRGIVVTAAHCVANYGQSQFYGGWRFVPGYRNGSAPFGTAVT